MENKITNYLNEIQVTYHRKGILLENASRLIHSSCDAAAIFKAIWQECLDYRESFYVLLLNRRNEVSSYFRVSQGSQSGTVADPKIIFQIALKCNASSLIVAHNHPSGNLNPSQADKELTCKLKEVGILLDLPLLDHLILTSEHYFSFADEGLL